MKERYIVIKSLYPNYLIFIKVKNKYKLLGIDKEIIDIFGLDIIKNVNYLKLDNLDIIEKKEYKNNNYNIYYLKTKLIMVLYYCKER